MVTVPPTKRWTWMSSPKIQIDSDLYHPVLAHALPNTPSSERYNVYSRISLYDTHDDTQRITWNESALYPEHNICYVFSHGKSISELSSSRLAQILSSEWAWQPLFTNTTKEIKWNSSNVNTYVPVDLCIVIASQKSNLAILLDCDTSEFGVS